MSLVSKMEDLYMARLKSLVVNSNECLNMKMIRNIEDLESDNVTFKPEMSHQVYGDRFVITILIINMSLHISYDLPKRI